jgi:hypothetical protein
MITCSPPRFALQPSRVIDASSHLPFWAAGILPYLLAVSDLPGIASWRTPQPVNTGRQSVRQLKTGVGAVKDEGPAAVTRPRSSQREDSSAGR